MQTRVYTFSDTLDIEVDGLFNKDVDIIHIKQVIPNKVVTAFVDAVEKQDYFQGLKLDLPDGFFSPMPYSVVHNDDTPEKGNLKSYFKTLDQFNNQTNELQIPLQQVQRIVEQIFNAEPLIEKSGKEFAPLGIRVLYAKKNGIDIHCENAFLHQLEPSFREWLYENVDIENAVSFFAVLQAPLKGGELFVYDRCWDEMNIPLNETTYDERHDIEGSMFSNRGFQRPSMHIINPSSKDVVLFRAAQLWHAINVIGLKDRISVGCFVAKGKNGKMYYWS